MEVNIKKTVYDMTPFELKRWSCLIDAVRLIEAGAKKRGIDMNNQKICQEYLNPKDILNYMEDACSKR